MSRHPSRRGPRPSRSVNQGQQLHKAILIQVAPGATLEEVLAAFEPGAEPQGPPPGLPIGGFQAIDPEGVGYITADLQPGNYGLVCGIPDPETGKPHAALGMIKEFTVK